jgi:hypothetical protein
MARTLLKTHWNNEAIVARLREHYEAGASFGIIADRINAEFSLNITRNSCVGKAKRLMFPKRLILHTETKKVAARPKPTRERRPKPPPKNVPKEKTVYLTDPSGPGITIYMLKSRSCRYPITDLAPGKFLFCGQATMDKDCPWCKHHHEIATVPIRRRTENIRALYR